MPSRNDGSQTIRASEVATYLFCARAWWYQRQGETSAPSAAQESGIAWHRRHGRRVLTASGLRLIGWALILAAAGIGAMLAASRLLS